MNNRKESMATKAEANQAARAWLGIAMGATAKPEVTMVAV